jgi:hypothetical protein
MTFEEEMQDVCARHCHDIEARFACNFANRLLEQGFKMYLKSLNEKEPRGIDARIEFVRAELVSIGHALKRDEGFLSWKLAKMRSGEWRGEAT